MFNDKNSVDQHVAEVTLTYTEYEINLSSYYIARNYYYVGDYETAREYVLRYLKVQEASADAYKLLGQILDARDQKEATLVKAKYSLAMDSKEVNFVYKSDPSSGISAALFHVRLLVHYIDNKKLEMGYKHAVDVEENYDFKDNLQWTQTVCRLLEMCKIMHSFDCKFWILYSSCLERLTKFFLKKGVDKPLPRFRPVIAKDTMLLNSFTKTISTRLYCVTCMKEYGGKSMEEVRLEYYIAGRKLQTQGLSSPLFSFGATDRSTAFRRPALITPSTAALRAPATTSRGFNLTPSTSTSQPSSQQIRPIPFGAAAQSSDLGFAETIQTPSKGFCANQTKKKKKKNKKRKPKAGDMFGLAGKLKTHDDVNSNMSFGQAEAGSLTSVEPASKTEDRANVAKASKPKTGGFNIVSSSATLPSLSFGTPATAPQGLASNFNLKIPKSNAVAAGYSAKAPAGITFGPAFSLGTPRNLGLLQNPAKPYAGLVLGSSGQSFSFQIPAKPTLKIPDGGKQSKHEVLESVDVHFAPVVQLPDKVDVETGEENEEILYSHRAKLFRYESKEKDWKERGLGQIKLLKHRETDKLRLLMRRDQVLKLCLNHIITPDLNFTPKDDRTWLWYAADYSTGDISHETFACRFRTAEIAQEFENAIHSARELTKAPADNAASSSSSDIEIVYEAIVTSEEKAAALKLKLPGNFYAYKKTPDCPGCIGCEDSQESSLVGETAEVSKTVIPQSSIATPKPVSAGIFDSKPSIFVPPKLNPPSQLIRTPVTSPSSPGDPKVTAFGSTPSTTQASTASANTISLSFVKKPVGTTFENVGSTVSVPSTTASTTGSGFSTKRTISFGAPATTTSWSNIFGGSSSSPATTSSSNIFGGSASMAATTGASSSFGANTPKTGGFLFGAQPAQPAPQAPAIPLIFGSVSTAPNTSTIFSFRAATNGKPAESGTATKSFKDLKICSPASLTLTTSPSAPNIPSPEMSEADQEFVEKSQAFEGLSTPVFGVPASIQLNPVVLESVNKASSETKKEGGFSFLLPENAASFSTLAAKALQQPAFRTDPNFSFAGAEATVFGAKQAVDGEPNNGEEHEPHFEPIIPLPDAIEVRTGEEDEEKVFGQRATLYRYVNATKEWKERGVGEMKLLHHVAHGTYRLLLRREQVHKVVCNLLLTTDTEFRTLNSSDRAWYWAGMNYAEEEPALEELAIKFKNPDLAVQFKEAIDWAQQALQERQNNN